MHKLVIGCGYLGHRVAQQWQQAGDHVSVLTRSIQRADQLAKEGLHPLVGDLTDVNSLPEFPACETILYAVGYDRSSGASIQQVYVEGLKHCLDALPATSGRIIYISSTGVYGQDDGNWVDESSPCHPTRPGGVACRNSAGFKATTSASATDAHFAIRSRLVASVTWMIS